jgi:hypothetical protein
MGASGEQRATVIKSLTNLIRVLRWVLAFGFVMIVLGVALGLVRSDLPPAATGALIGTGVVCGWTGLRDSRRVQTQIRALQRESQTVE